MESAPDKNAESLERGDDKLFGSVEETAHQLAQSIDNLDPEGIKAGIEGVDELLIGIEHKYNSLLNTLTQVVGISGGLAGGAGIMDYLNPEAAESFGSTFADTLANGAGLKYAAVAATVVVAIKCGKTIMRWKEKAEVADTLRDAFVNNRNQL